MNLKDLARLLNECNDDVEQTNHDVTVIHPQRRTRLIENLIACKDVLSDEQKKEMQNALNLIDGAKVIRDEQVKVKPKLIEELK